LGWAIGQAAIASHMAIISIYLLFYLNEVHHFSGSLAGALLLAPRVWNILSDPVVGGISDRWRSRLGRRRPFLLFGAVVWSLAFVAMFWMPADFSLSGKACWFLVCYLLANTGLSLYHVPYSAMAAEMTQDYDERLRLIGYKEVAARATVLTTVLVSPLILKLSADPLIGNRWLGVATGLLILVSGVVAFVMTRRAPAVAFQPQTASWSEQLRSFKANKPLFVLSGAFLLSSACDAFYSALLIYFILTLGHSAGLMGVLYPMGSLAAMVATAVWAKMGSRWGKRQACQAAFAGAALCFLLSLCIPSGQASVLVVFMAVLGTFFGGVFMLPGAMVPDTVEYDEKISGTRREGTIFGAWIFTQQTGMALGGFLVGVYLDLIGHGTAAAGVANPQEALGLKLGFALVPAALFGVGLLILRHFSLERADLVARQPSTMTNVGF
jgi:sugar (glycoside-pentoside-hexuronide) transporter